MNPTIAARRTHATERAQQRRAIRKFTDQERHDRNNLEAATIIANAGPAKYPA